MKNLTLKDFIEEIDFDMLKEQKTELLKFHVDGTNYDTQKLANCVEGIICLLDRIQDIAVDEIGKVEEEIFDFSDGYDENAVQRKEEKEVDDEKTMQKIRNENFDNG